MSTAKESGEYVVVARRYRPLQFDELLGQEHVAKALRGAIESERVGHAYLFTGARGVGKTSAARILAKALNCSEGPSPTPCNECDACLAIAAGDDIDVLEIDGASNRGIDEIRQLRQNVSIRPSRSRFKIYIIDEVHMLTREAFNALLKTLEEPPEHVKFIFCTTESEKVPVTVLSRCQRFDFAGIQTPAITARLRQIVDSENVQADDEALEILARRAGGSMRDSQSLLEQLLSLGEDRLTAESVHQLLGTASAKRLAEIVQHVVAQNAAAAIAGMDAALAEGVDVGQLLEQLLGYLRDLMVSSVGAKDDAYLFAGKSDDAWLTAAARELGTHTVVAMMQVVDHALERMRVSVHRRTLAELAVVRLCSLGELRDLSAVVESLRAGSLPAPDQAATKIPAPVKKNAESPPAAADNGALTAPAATNIAPRPAQDVTSTAELTQPASPQVSVKPDAATSAAAVDKPPSVSPSELWRTALAGVSNLVADHAAFANQIEYDGPNALVVEFAAEYSFQKSMCERGDQARMIAEAVNSVAGRPMVIHFRLGQEADVKNQKGRQTVRRAAPVTVRDYIDNPLVKSVAETFSATPLKVEPPPQSD
ncbi:MAG: DNA polymerase III subunit gamma/tau [Pirellulales bacterium]|nr:DNA polymerase III subunit gamma/tau [Pirellulales bacterium]